MFAWRVLRGFQLTQRRGRANGTAKQVTGDEIDYFEQSVIGDTISNKSTGVTCLHQLGSALQWLGPAAKPFRCGGTLAESMSVLGQCSLG